MKNTLMCTFTHSSVLPLTLDYLSKVYDPPYILIYQNANYTSKMYCVYSNVHRVTDNTPNTISIHRKHTNTLYTINALNALIRAINNGVLDTSLAIQWENYENTFLTVTDGEVEYTPIKFHSKVNLN